MEDVSDHLRARAAEHDESVGAIVVANSKLARSTDVHIEDCRNELLYYLLEANVLLRAFSIQFLVL